MKYMSIYITFKDENSPKRESTFIKRTILKFLYCFIPKANSDFESKIDLVKTWYLEFVDKESVPIREVGLDSENNVILKMPFKNNYGYWTDNLLKFNDFDRLFNITIINEELFIELWEKLNEENYKEKL